MKFISYEICNNQNEEKCDGVATVCVNLELILRYKMALTKNGGKFLCPPSVKINDQYKNAFEIDSNIKKLEIEEFIKENIKKLSAAHTSQPTPTINNSPTAQQEIYTQDNLPF